MRNSKTKSAKKTKEMFWVKFQKYKDGFHLIKIQKQLNSKTNKRNLKIFIIQLCKKLIKVLLKEETVANNTIKDLNRIMLDQAQMKLTEIFNDFFLTHFNKYFFLLIIINKNWLNWLNKIDKKIKIKNIHFDIIFFLILKYFCTVPFWK